jgi:hypothetical protein
MVPAVINVAGIMSCFEVNFGCSEKTKLSFFCEKRKFEKTKNAKSMFLIF